ncbi:MAG: histidine kinase [Acidovorax sp.]|uniref:sensor histidine kinase n=1 Tax=Acidovorax sp. TaxID=1872122 RepID=UPI0039E48DF7
MKQTAPRIHWLGTARHLLQVVAFCGVVAVLTTTIWPRNSYWMQLAHALCIGLVIWGVIEFGRLLVPARHCHPASEGSGPGWPKGWRGLVLAAIGIGAGFLLGDPLGAWLTGTGSIRSTRDDQIGLVITITAGSVASFYFHMRGRAAVLEASRAAAERDTTEARLMLLQSQLEPHMLFNTLAALRALIAVDPPRAEAMLDRMVDFLRATLSASRTPLHPLSAEFARLADYLELMALRMGPRLAYTLDLPPDLADAPVPPLLLQPLVENAIRHGLEPHLAGGRIDVSAQQLPDGRIRLTVADTGADYDGNKPPRTGHGFGLAQVRERLANRYGSAAALEIGAGSAGGTSASIVFPLEESPPCPAP